VSPLADCMEGRGVSQGLKDFLRGQYSWRQASTNLEPRVHRRFVRTEPVHVASRSRWEDCHPSFVGEQGKSARRVGPDYPCSRLPAALLSNGRTSRRGRRRPVPRPPSFNGMRPADPRLWLLDSYTAPRLAVGDRTFCLLRDQDVVITSWTDAQISWPRCRALHHRGGSGLLLDDELARAVRNESALAIGYWWGVTDGVVWRWRKILGVGRMDDGDNSF
jgi:hypothetical protein